MKTGDKIVAIIVVLMIVGSIFLIPNSNENLKNKYVTVKVDNKVVKKISIKDEMEGTYDFPFRDQVGYIEIKNGAVRMLPMNKEICPKSICSQTGWIKNQYKIIVCLPNRIAVSIEGDVEEDSNDIDGISS